MYGEGLNDILRKVEREQGLEVEGRWMNEKKGEKLSDKVEK